MVENVAVSTAAPLAALIRDRRTSSRLTQEELAERAGISVRTVSDIERGLRRSVYKDTARRLADALSVADSDRENFLFVALGRMDASEGGLRLDPRWKSSNSGHIPIPPTGLVGREREMERLLTAFRNPGIRVITLTGPGGIGKTRLAAEAAIASRSIFPDGVFFVALGAAESPSRAMSRVAEAVGITESDARSVADIARYLGSRAVLLVLDTFEHLLDAAASLAELASLCERLVLLITSREPLRIRGEHVVAVPPLELPLEGSTDLSSWASGRLLLERGRAAGAQLPTDEESAVLLGDICRRLEGVPLAIELAAPRIRHLPLAKLRDQLDSRLSVLIRGGVDLPQRHRTMRATIGWSYDLLDAEERSLFRSLSVFEGGWALEAVDDVVGASEKAALDTLSALVDKSLVVLTSSGGRFQRYSMMGVIGEFAAEQRDRCGETADLVDRHARYFLSVAEGAEEKVGTSAQEESYLELLADHDNLMAALRRSFADGDPQIGLRLAASLWQFWRAVGYVSEGRSWLEQGLSVDAPASRRARALWGASWLAFQQDDLRAARRYSNELLAVTLDDETSLARRHALTVHAMILMAEGEYEAALAPLERCVGISESSESSWFIATSQVNLALALLHLRQLERAALLLNGALELYERIGDQRFVSRAHTYLGHLALLEGDVARAGNLFRRSLRSSMQISDEDGVAVALEGSAAVSAAGGSMETAALLLGVGSRVREQAMSKTLAFERPLIDRWLDQARDTLRDEAWTAFLDKGSAMDTDEALALLERK
jgi:predicted ATPase/transcriptional regulator with XRE-family HTH domain